MILTEAGEPLLTEGGAYLLLESYDPVTVDAELSINRTVSAELAINRTVDADLELT